MRHNLINNFDEFNQMSKLTPFRTLNIFLQNNLCGAPSKWSRESKRLYQNTTIKQPTIIRLYFFCYYRKKLIVKALKNEYYTHQRHRAYNKLMGTFGAHKFTLYYFCIKY